MLNEFYFPDQDLRCFVIHLAEEPEHGCSLLSGREVRRREEMRIDAEAES